MELELKGKRALVTGSTSGIGAFIAEGLAREGVRVVIHGRNAASAERVAEGIRSAGGVAAVALGDLGDDAAAGLVAQAALYAFGGIDIVINNVGIAEEDSWDDVSASDWAKAYDTNVLSTVRMIQHLLPPMKERGWGRFVQIASIAALHPEPNYTAYGAAKAAILNLTVTLAKSLANTGITANTVSPGIILSSEIRHWVEETAKSEQWEGAWSDHERHFIQQFAPNLVGRMGRPEEIADLVAFLTSPRADYITATHFEANGGHRG